MARKNLLDGLADMPTGNNPVAAYPMRGAGKSLVRSLDEIAKQAEKFLEGETVVELDPASIDVSFVQDRLSDDDEEFERLVEAIRAHGQNTPILVRPNRDADGRYQVVFGHRRLRAAARLGRPVRAVVKPVDDHTHVIAQGQENSARANLSFIERALFAKQLSNLNYDREVISTALAANAALISKMFSVTDRIDDKTIAKIGPAPGIGRERWVELSLLITRPSSSSALNAVLEGPAFGDLSSDDRFTSVYSALKKRPEPVKKASMAVRKTKWQPSDEAVVAEIKSSSKAYSLSMKSKIAGRFGDYISRNLESLYEQFLAEDANKGD
jgi:ParB family transcriptional regulator, chromosome partitioning protein